MRSNSTQTSSHGMETSHKTKSKLFTTPNRDQETMKLLRNDDTFPPVSRSTSVDISRDNTINNSIATQQTFLVVDRETDTTLFKKYYQDSGMQSEQSPAPSEETIMPKSSSDSNKADDEDEEISISSSSSAVLAPKNSKNNMKTPEAGDKATPRVEKTEEVVPQMLASSSNQITLPLNRNVERALVPYEEDTLRILLNARSKLMEYLEDGDSVVIAKEAEVLLARQAEEVSDLVPDEDPEEVRRKRKKTIDDVKTETYKNMQSDIKEMITDLLLQSSEIKGEALNAGVLEDDSPPLICDFLDSYYSSASADVAYILDCILEKVDEKIKKPVGIGDAQDVKSTLRPFLIPTGQNNVAETYFCTASFDRIPKTSWVFGGNRKKSKFSPKKPKKDVTEDDVLLQSLEGCYDLLTGLFDNNKEQLVCMIHNENIKKSEKGFDLRSGHRQHGTKNTLQSRTILTPEEEKYVNSVYPSSSSSAKDFIETSETPKLPPNTAPVEISSGSSESTIKSRARPLKRKKQVLSSNTSDLSGYNSDGETSVEEEVKSGGSKPKKMKSRLEVNSAEEIRRIEENVAQNKMLEKRGCTVLNRSVEHYDTDTSSNETLR